MRTAATTSPSRPFARANLRRAAQWLIGQAFHELETPNQAAPLTRRGIHRVLVCRVSHTLGNTLLVTPLIHEIARLFPGAEVDVVTRSAVADELFPRFDRVRTVFRLPNHGLASPHRVAAVIRAVRARAYDLAIDPGLLSTTDRLYVLAANARWKLGYASKLGRGLTHAVAAPPHLLHVGKLPVYLLRKAVRDDDQEPYPGLDLALSPTERAWGRGIVEQIAGRSGPITGLFTGATGAKHLGAEWWRRFASEWARTHPGARLIEFIPLAGRSMLEDRWPTYYSTDVRRLAAVISAVTRFVAADCGVMHLASAANAPTAGLFRGTRISEWAPYGPHDLALDVTAMEPETAARVVAAAHGRLVH
ncbi:MAG TPA: glycosyltransferase family 9 protein [Rhodanobacteraceae bacterium]